MALTGTFEELTNLFIFAGMDFLWTGSGGAVPLAKNRAGNAAAVSLLGLPVGAGNFCGRRAGADGQHLMDRPGRSSIGLLLILAGLPFYRYWSACGWS